MCARSPNGAVSGHSFSGDLLEKGSGMASARETTTAPALPLSLVTGAAAGVVAGIPLGIIMQVRDADPTMMPGITMMDLVGDLVSDPSAGLGWLIHLFNSALFGAIFVLLFSRWLSQRGPAMVLGLLYGVAWWVVGALWIMPAWLGMDDMVFEVGDNQWWSLVGHLIYGLLLAALYIIGRSMLSKR
jgi:hypothetical protein